MDRESASNQYNKPVKRGGVCVPHCDSHHQQHTASYEVTSNQLVGGGGRESAGQQFHTNACS